MVRLLVAVQPVGICAVKDGKTEIYVMDMGSASASHYQYMAMIPNFLGQGCQTSVLFIGPFRQAQIYVPNHGGEQTVTLPVTTMPTEAFG